MTAPTPDLDYDTIWEAGRADGYEAGRDEYAHALAAVTAERDQERGQHEATKSTLDKAWDDLRQARQMLADAEKKIASMELDESLREEDERFADPL